MENENHDLLLEINFEMIHNKRIIIRPGFICYFFEVQYFQFYYLNIHGELNPLLGCSVDHESTDHNRNFDT